VTGVVRGIRVLRQIGPRARTEEAAAAAEEAATAAEEAAAAETEEGGTTAEAVLPAADAEGFIDTEPEAAIDTEILFDTEIELEPDPDPDPDPDPLVVTELDPLIDADG